MDKNNIIHEDDTVVVSPKSPDTRWVTLDENYKIISEGKTPDEAVDEAKKTTQDYTLMFVPVEGHTYFF